MEGLPYPADCCVQRKTTHLGRKQLDRDRWVHKWMIWVEAADFEQVLTPYMDPFDARLLTHNMNFPISNFPASYCQPPPCPQSPVPTITSKGFQVRMFGP